MKYRYILNNSVTPNDKIKNFRLIDSTNLSGSYEVIKIEIPKSVKLEKFLRVPYSTTTSSLKIKDLNLKTTTKWII